MDMHGFRPDICCFFNLLLFFVHIFFYLQSATLIRRLNIIITRAYLLDELFNP